MLLVVGAGGLSRCCAGAGCSRCENSAIKEKGGKTELKSRDAITTY